MVWGEIIYPPTLSSIKPGKYLFWGKSTTACAIVNQIFDRLLCKTWLFFSIFPIAELRVDWQLHKRYCTFPCIEISLIKLKVRNKNLLFVFFLFVNFSTVRIRTVSYGSKPSDCWVVQNLKKLKHLKSNAYFGCYLNYRFQMFQTSFSCLQMSI